MEPTDDKGVESALKAYSDKYKTPIRGFRNVKWIHSFYGTREQKEELVSVESLKRAINEATEEFNELMCHVGYSDDYLRENSSYNDIREKELETVMSPKVKEYINSQKDLKLCNWNLVKEKLL